MRKIKLIIISTIIIFGLIFAQNKAYAEITDDTIKLQKGSYFSKPLSFQSGDSLTITYRIGVIEGPHIDVFFFDSINFSYYKNNRPFSFIAGLSDEYTKYTNNEMRITIHDDYYLVFDNSDKGATQPPNDNATAYISYQIMTIPLIPDSGNGGNINTPGFELIILIVAIAILLIKIKKKL